MENETEIWRRHPEIDKIEVSSFGRVRTLDKIVPSSWNATRLVKGKVLKQHGNGRGYLNVSIKIAGKWIPKSVHRLVAQTFIPNPDNLPEVNHKDCDRANNRSDNLEWVTHEENTAYRDKLGHTARNNAPKSPVLAINLATWEVHRFPSIMEVERKLGVNHSNIISVIKGSRKQTGGFWFVSADNKAVDLTKRKLREIGKTKLIAADSASADFVSQVIT